MKKGLLLVCMFWLLTSCNKINADLSKFEGTYIGYYHRDGRDTTRVSLSFAGNTYQGFSAMPAYPALGKGSFDQNDNTINFTDSSMWAASLDKSYILKGAYHYQYNDDGTVRIWRDDSHKMDEFILRRPVR